MKNVEIFGKRVLVKILEDSGPSQVGGVILSSSSQKKTRNKGLVVKITACPIPEELPKLSVGEHVLLSDFGGHEITLDGDAYKVMDLDSILLRYNNNEME